MTAPTEGLPRLLRAASLGAVTVALSLLAHVSGGGGLPGPTVLAVLLAVTVTAALVASGHRLGAARLTALLTSGQAALHTTLATLSTSGVEPHALGHVVGGGHHATLVPHAHVAATHAGHHHGSAMLAAHLAATVVTALVLSHGERALWVVAGWVAPVIRVAGAVPARSPGQGVPAPAVPRLRGAGLVLVAPRRGPPLVACPR